MPRQREQRPTETRALIERAGDERLIARPEGVDAPWEFPGGPVEGRESPEQALRRLCKARLGVELDLRLGQPPFVEDVGGQPVVFRYYMCSIRAGEPEPRGYAELRWVRTGQLREYIFSAAAQKVVDWLLAD